MDKKELVLEVPGKRVYATEEAMIRRVEFTGAYADVRNTMHCFIGKGFFEMEVTCSFLEQVSENEHHALKVLELPMTLTVIHGGDEPAYAYYLEQDGKEIPVERNALLEETVIEEALLNMEDTGRYVWDILSNYFAQFDISLGQIDLRFGHVMEHFVVMCGDFTPETMHLFDPESGKRYWDGEGGMENAYEKLLARMGAER